jgi:hypothetical protein
MSGGGENFSSLRKNDGACAAGAHINAEELHNRRDGRISLQHISLVASEGLPMELHGLAEVGQKITRPVVAGIEMKFMFDLFGF